MSSLFYTVCMYSTCNRMHSIHRRLGLALELTPHPQLFDACVAVAVSQQDLRSHLLVEIREDRGASVERLIMKRTLSDKMRIVPVFGPDREHVPSARDSRAHLRRAKNVASMQLSYFYPQVENRPTTTRTRAHPASLTV